MDWLSGMFGGERVLPTLPAEPARPVQQEARSATGLINTIPVDAPTTRQVASDPVSRYVDPYSGQMTAEGRERLDNPALGFDTGGIGGIMKGFHGSPHAFDRFDNAAIGSGEGAQAYGYGHYIADNEGVAQSYKTAGPAAYTQIDAINKQLSQLAKQLGKFSPGEKGKYKQPEGNVLKAQYDALMEQRSNLGHMYEVNVNAEPEHFLDWDKPLSEQHPDVQKALTPEALGLKPKGPVGEKGYHGWTTEDGRLIGTARTGGLPESPFDPKESGQSIYKMLHSDPTKAAVMLNEAGIPGIRYLDQGSRRPVEEYQAELSRTQKYIASLRAATTKTTGDPNADPYGYIAEAQAKLERLRADPVEGSRNTVVFDPSTMDIIRRYGIAGLMAGAGVAATQGRDQTQ
jgi:hypothetical protein